MTTHDMSERELVSALADGQLQGDDIARALALIERSEEARAYWHACHLVGDVLRAQELAADAARDAVFVARLRQRLQAEAPQPSPVDAIESVAAGADAAGVVGQNHAQDPAANDASLRWKLVAGFASLAAVAAVGWQLVTQDGTAQGSAQLAQAGGEPAQVVLRDPRLDQLLAAHQQFGGTSALQMPAGFLRNATFEGPIR